MIGSSQNGEECGSLLEEIGEALFLLVDEIAREDGVGGVGANDECAANDSGGVSDRGVAVGPVRAFVLEGVAVGKEDVFDENAFAALHY